MAKFSLQVILPNRLLCDFMVDSVNVPAISGEMVVLHKHEPYIVALTYGEIKFFGAERVLSKDITVGNDKDTLEMERIFIAGGVMHVTPEYCKILAEEAILFSERVEANKILESLRQELKQHGLIELKRTLLERRISFYELACG